MRQPERQRYLLNAYRVLLTRARQGAAASLREGPEETLTVLKLGLTPTLRRSLACTDAIENLGGAQLDEERDAASRSCPAAAFPTASRDASRWW